MAILCQCSFFSGALHSPSEIIILLPSPAPSQLESGDYNAIYQTGQNYRTLTLLHGMQGDHTSWLRHTRIERFAQDAGLAIVLPAGLNSYYENLSYSLNYFTYLTEELPRFTQSIFPLSGKREDNFIAGLSMGGYGACHAALAHPDRYAAFASLSGALDSAMLERTLSGPACHCVQDIYRAHANDSSGQALLRLAQQAMHAQYTPKGYLVCGNSDPVSLQINRFIKNGLDKISYPFIYEEGEGGHDWDFWDTAIQKVLRWLTAI